MDAKTAIKFFDFINNTGILFFRLSDLRLWPENTESDDSLRESIKHYCAAGLFLRVCDGIYINGLVNPFQKNPFARYSLANELRPNSKNWESLESRLSDIGIISQVPNRLTFMTTGKAGIEKTALGTFEFSHAPVNFDPDVRFLEETGSFHATASQAWKDLQFVNRNTDLVDLEALGEAIEEEKNFVKIP